MKAVNPAGLEEGKTEIKAGTFSWKQVLLNAVSIEKVYPAFSTFSFE